MTKFQVALLLLGSLATVALGGDDFNPPERYVYNAELIDVYDGDTVTVRIDHGFNISSVQKIRLMGIDTPERRGPQKKMGMEARERFLQLAPIDGTIILKTVKDRTGKYGRYMGIIFSEDEAGWFSVNNRLVTEGYADEYNGIGKRRDWTKFTYPLEKSRKAVK